MRKNPDCRGDASKELIGHDDRHQRPGGTSASGDAHSSQRNQNPADEERHPVVRWRPKS